MEFKIFDALFVLGVYKFTPFPADFPAGVDISCYLLAPSPCNL